MKIGILGSGMVGQALAAKFEELGVDVMVGTRDPQKLSEWLADHPGVKAGSFGDSAAFGEIVFNATKGDAALDVLKSVGQGPLQDKILIDIANPLDFSQGMPPTLFVSNTDSLGEQVQQALPETKVVKTFNTLAASLMVDPLSLADGDHTLFICGNDDEAKERVMALFGEWYGWRDIIDLGDITNSRATESLLPIWIRLYMKYGTGNLQFKIVR